MCLLTLSFMPSVLQNVGIDLNLQECEEKKSKISHGWSKLLA
jgi:hypothetical protein